MAGFTIQLDVSQLVSGAQKGQQSIASLGREFKLVTKDAGELAKATQGAGQSAIQAGNNFSQLSNRIGEYAKRIAVLYGAYRTLDAVLGTVRRGLDFSASLESSEIAIASVIAATNKLSDSTGKQLEGVEKFNAAQELSKDIMDEIQVLALQTTATFDSLADGVAGIVAPATKFGVSMEKLPSFAVKAAQAMTTMKIPVQQMRTEIEALLSGNINRAQDILATNLGITGEMVRNWQQQGVLVEELEKRLEAFAIAGDRVADSWSGLRGNMEDALNYLSGKTGRGIFEGAKQAYRELLDLMVSTEGKIGVGKDVENLVELLTDVQNVIGQELVDATRGFIELIRELNEPESVDKIRRTFVATAETVRGVATGLSDMKEGVAALVEMLGADPTVTAAGGLVGYKLFGPKGLLLGLISDVVLKGLEQIGKFFAFIQDKAGFGGKDVSGVQEAVENGETGNTLQDVWGDTLGPQAEEINKALNEAEEVGRKTAEAYKKAFDNSLDVLGGLVSPVDNKKDVDVTPAISGGKSAKDLERERREAQRVAKQAEKDEQERLRTKADLLHQLGELTGDTNKTTEAQTMLIQQQADAFRKVLPEMSGYIDQWEQLKIAQTDPALFLSGEQQIKRLEDTWDDFFKNSMDWGTSLGTTFTGMTDSMAGAFVDMATSGSASFKELANNAVKDLSRIAAQMAMVWTIQQALGWASGFLGGGAGGARAASAGDGTWNGNFNFGSSLALTRHSGGMADGSGPYRLVPSALFADAPRFHSGTGYIKPGEYPAILKAGERVLSPAETRAYQSGGVVNNINISTPAGYEAQEKRTPNAQGGEDVQISFIRRVVAGDMNTYGSQINRAMRTQGARLPVMRGGG